MFFVAILGSYIIFRAGVPKLFAKNAETLSKVLAGTNTVVLIFSSLTMALAVDASPEGQPQAGGEVPGVTLLCAFGFLGDQGLRVPVASSTTSRWSQSDKPSRPAAERRSCYDAPRPQGTTRRSGRVKHALPKMPMPRDRKAGTEFDMTPASVEPDDRRRSRRKAGPAGTRRHGDRPRNVTNALNYGPWRNVFFSSYFTLTGVHGMHVIGGIIPLASCSSRRCAARRSRGTPSTRACTGTSSTWSGSSCSRCCT